MPDPPTFLNGYRRIIKMTNSGEKLAKFAEKQRFASLYNNNQDSISAINQLSFADAQSRFHIGNKSKQSSNKSKQSRLHISNNQLSFAIRRKAKICITVQ